MEPHAGAWAELEEKEAAEKMHYERTTAFIPYSRTLLGGKRSQPTTLAICVTFNKFVTIPHSLLDNYQQEHVQEELE